MTILDYTMCKLNEILKAFIVTQWEPTHMGSTILFRSSEKLLAFGNVNVKGKRKGLAVILKRINVILFIWRTTFN